MVVGGYGGFHTHIFSQNGYPPSFLIACKGRKTCRSRQASAVTLLSSAAAAATLQYELVHMRSVTHLKNTHTNHVHTTYVLCTGETPSRFFATVSGGEQKKTHAKLPTKRNPPQ